MNPTIAPIFDGILQDPNLLLLGFVKVLFVVGGLLYALFALLVIRQIQLMRTTVHTGFSAALMLVGISHFLLSVVVVIYYLAL